MNNPNQAQAPFLSQHHNKQALSGNQDPVDHTMMTAVKKNQFNQGYPYTQTTPRPIKKVLFYDEERKKHLFNLVRDKQVGITGKFQNIVHESFNDDDRATSSTQLYRGMGQTIEDLYEVINPNFKPSTQ